jgi:fluoroacetyl-CoA thioesterase
MKETLRPGLKVDFTYRVPSERTVPNLLPESVEFGSMPEVLATGYLVALFEWACMVAVNPHLDWPEEQTVGTHVNLSHTAATPPGLTVHVRGQLTAIDGRKLTFRIEAHDGVDLISEGTHERFIIDRSKFDKKTIEKSEMNNR